MVDNFQYLQQMKSRLSMGTPNDAMAALARVDLLEKTLSIFRAEVDMKLKIMQQILTTRNEQVSIQKRLLDREQTLYSALLNHWENSSQLAATGISVNLSSNNAENSESQFDPDQDSGDGGTNIDPFSGMDPGQGKSKSSRRSRKKRKSGNAESPAEDVVSEDSLSSSGEEQDDGDTWVYPGGYMKAETGGNNMGFAKNKRAGERARGKDRKRGEGFVYNKVATFPTFEEASDYLKTQDIWTRNSKTRTSEGEKIYYYCKHSHSCDSRVYVLCDAASAAVFQTPDSHNHVEKARKNGLPGEMRWRINELYAAGVTKPKAILSHLSSIGLEGPPLRQLCNYLGQYKKKHSNSGNNSMPMGHQQHQLSSSSSNINEAYGEEHEGFEMPVKVTIGEGHPHPPFNMPMVTPSTSFALPHHQLQPSCTQSGSILPGLLEHE